MTPKTSLDDTCIDRTILRLYLVGQAISGLSSRVDTTSSSATGDNNREYISNRIARLAIDIADAAMSKF